MEHTDEENQLSFLPFHAINEFMLPEYRHEVITMVLTSLRKTSPHRKNQIELMTKKWVRVTGFRNSVQAPVPLRIKPSTQVFTKIPQFTAQILQAWSELNLNLRANIHVLLTERGWDLLPENADRTRLPGFMPSWRKDETFETINQAYKEKYHDDNYPPNDISLMAVWISNCLPYNDEMVN